MNVAVATKPQAQRKPARPASKRESEASGGRGRGAASGLPRFLQCSALAEPGLAVQRQAAEPAEELVEEPREESVFRSVLASPPRVQAKLTVGAPDDEYEREADAVADRVMRQPDPLPEGDVRPELPVQPQLLVRRYLQRLCAECAAEQPQPSGCCSESHGASLQRKTEGASPPQPSASIARTIRFPGGGAPLSRAVRSRVEPVLGRDLGAVRVHTGTEAGRAAETLSARAFTHRNHIWLGSGQNASDDRLMAHEATHVVQQGYAGKRIPSRATDTASATTRRVRAKVQRDATNQTITAEYARALDAAALTREITQVQTALAQRTESSDEGRTLTANLRILRAEMASRTQSVVPRPPGLPMDQGFTLRPLPSELESLFGDIPEGRLVNVSLAGMGPVSPTGEPGGAFDPTALSSPGSGAALSMLRSIDAGLMRTGFAAAGSDAIGLVGVPRWFTAGARIPESMSMWGHTAVYVRQGGTISIVRGFTVESMLATMRSAGAIEGGLAGTPAYLANDVGLFTRTGAMSIEYPVSSEVARSMARRLPATGPPTGATPSTYTARPAVRCMGSNCVLWAVGEAEGGLRGPIGPRGPGASVTALGEGGAIIEGTASQGRLMNFMRLAAEGAEHATVPPGATGAPVAAGMTRGMQVLKWGGRVMLVVGVVLIPVEVAMAPEGQRARTAVGATTGFLGGLATGAAAGLVCGPGALVCSVVMGLVGGIGGYFGGRALGEAIYDAPSGSLTGSYNSPLFVCFTADTPVRLADGTERPISEIEPGQEVLAFDEEASTCEPCKVVRVHRNPPQDHLRIELQGGAVLKVTVRHHLHAGAGWKAAGELEPGDTLLRVRDDGTELEPVAIERITRKPASVEVYDLTVERCHTYFAAGVLAHNKLP